MHHTTNRIVLQGRTGPPTVRLSPAGPIFASAELQIEDQPDVTITVSGYGIAAAGIAEPATGKILRVTGTLCFDLASQSFYVLADHVWRMEHEAASSFRARRR
jgi:hypothetical protein